MMNPELNLFNKLYQICPKYVSHHLISYNHSNLLVNFFSSFFVCAVSHRQIHKIRVPPRQKRVERCFLDQTTNEGCPVDKFPFNFL
jgi:hypothetical protein